MIKAPIILLDLRRRIYRKAKSDNAHRFLGIFVHVVRTETLHEIYRLSKRNGGAHGWNLNFVVWPKRGAAVTLYS
jgi:hypothetical protein